jgi:hypothetical protein
MSDVKLIIDGAKLHELLHGPAGAIWPWLDRRADVVKQACIAQAPEVTGCLKGTILKRPIEASSIGLSIRIVSDTATCSPSHTSYSYWVHEGAPPHDIPNAFGRGPTFGIGGPFAGKFHPGNKPNKYLSDNLHLFNA